MASPIEMASHPYKLVILTVTLTPYSSSDPNPNCSQSPSHIVTAIVVLRTSRVVLEYVTELQ